MYTTTVKNIKTTREKHLWIIISKSKLVSIVKIKYRLYNKIYNLNKYIGTYKLFVLILNFT